MNRNMEKKTEYRRILPHLNYENSMFFITYRIAGSLPKHILKEYIYEKKNNQIPPKLFEKYEDYLDTKNGELSRTDIAKVVDESLWHYHKKHFNLLAFCIMPNHVHFLINTNGYPYRNLYSLMKSIKGVSANKINKILGKSGQFWHHESYDRMVRDINELSNTIEYILNPVKAKLVNNWRNWEYTYVNERYLNE